MKKRPEGRRGIGGKGLGRDEEWGRLRGGGAWEEDGEMRLVYIDESGDPGARNSPTRHYVLAGLCVDERDWSALHGSLLRLRHQLDEVMWLNAGAEMHAAEFLGGARVHLGLEPWQRVRAAQWVIRELKARQVVATIVAARDKSRCPDPLGECWRELCGKAATMGSREDGYLLLVTDMTDGKRVRQALENLDTQSRRLVIDEPFHRDSRESLILQAADLLAYLGKQSLSPNGLFRTGLGNGLLKEFRNLTSFEPSKEQEPGRGPGS